MCINYDISINNEDQKRLMTHPLVVFELNISGINYHIGDL